MLYKHIIWDWNGTLLDDVEESIATINLLLKKRKLKPIASKQDYQNMFCFPVIDYYQKLGFDFNIESFQNVADEYIDIYLKEAKKAQLNKDAIKILKLFQDLKIKQTIISASSQPILNQQIEQFKISSYFEQVLGINNNLATSKVALAKKYFQEANLNSKEVLLIGDTLHDYQVAKELNCKAILVACGHQSKEIISECDQVVDNFDELLQLMVK